MDLVQAPVERAAAAVQETFAKFVAPAQASLEWHDVDSLDSAFRLVGDFANIPSQILLFPTMSKWTILWNNCFLCDGYDSLCSLLSKFHNLTTVHWEASDQWTTFQSGAMFHLRRPGKAGLIERRVQAAQTDKRWDFFEQGEPLPEEDIAGYAARKKRDRLNEARIAEFLGRLGAEPWNEAFYKLPGRVGLVSRPVAATVLKKSAQDVLSQRRYQHT